MKLRAHKSSTTIYQMFCDYKSRQDFIGMDMHFGSSLRWDLLAPDGMLIILRGKNMTPRVIAHHSQQNGATVKKLGPQRSSKKRETWQLKIRFMWR